MTRSRTLKSVIRTRMAKTGERYTAARRHVLADTTPAPAPSPRLATTRPVAVEAKGAVSSARVLERTGHDLEYWYAVLDRAGAVEHGHTAAARHLRDVHGVDAWYSQGITVSYERARGLRAMHERPGGTFEGSVSKTIAADIQTVLAAFSTPRRRARWCGALGAEEAGLLASAVRGPASQGFVARARGEHRCRHRGAHGLLELTLTPKAAAATTVLVLHSGVPTRNRLDDVRRQWRAALAALAALLAD